MRMQKLEYEVRFLTPAFLGNAEQSGQWRTPPFKALLRQWWRVAYAADHGFEVDLPQMRREEGMLFGNAWLSHRENRREILDHRESLVLLRLNRWDQGRLKSWQGLEEQSVVHPEVQRTKYRVGPHAYLGYGPLDARGGTQLDQKRNAAIQPGESALFSLAYPRNSADPEIRQILVDIHNRILVVLWLINQYGTLGGRSRNGWGSFSLTPLGDTPTLKAGVNKFTRVWKDAFKYDWPHAVGQDGKGVLIWQTRPFDDWRPLMRELAIVKIGLRTQFVFPSGQPPHPNVESRHWLSYPITTHTTRAWNRGARLPNSLRFKVRETAEGRLIGVIFHVPCSPPKEFHPDRAAILDTWRAVHELLDELTVAASSRSYTIIADRRRRATLEPSLNQVVLSRVAE